MMRGQYKNGKPFDRVAYMKEYNKRAYAMDCENQKERARLYRLTYPEIVKATRSDWYTKNGVDYRKAHMKEISRNNVKYAALKRKNDPLFLLKCRLRGRLISALKSKTSRNTEKALTLLGCTVQHAKEHIEKQFHEGMTWKNHGVWVIDHIIPIASFDLTDPDQLKQAFHYTNLQPLMWQENARKGKKVQ